VSKLTLSTTGIELLDDPAADDATVELSLANIARSNRWFGGLAAVRFGLRQLFETAPGRPVTLLDVGTGLGDVPAMARRWGAARGIEIRPIGLERHRAAARLATNGGLATALGDAGDLPMRDRSVDVVIASQLAHHLDPASCVALFRECDRVARTGVIIADLQRSRLAAAGFRMGGTLLGFDRITITDGITSLRRGFTRSALASVMARAGIHGTVARRPGARIVAVWRTTA
jgi:ubiquinone/menaquinone biosynthesis C-methylase UbiE